MSATHYYDSSGLVDHVTYGNGTSIDNTYDAALRLTHIDHQDGVGATILDLEYTYIRSVGT